MTRGSSTTSPWVPTIPPSGLTRWGHAAMDCTFELILAQVEADYAGTFVQAAFAELDRLEGELSRFRPGSDISRINQAPAGQPVKLGPDALDCLAQAQALATATQYAFDVTLGTGSITLDTQRKTCARHSDTTRVDLGAIGKGYALDRLLELATQWQIETLLIHAGQSSIAARGSPDGNGAGWPIALRHPQHHQQTIGTLRLHNRAAGGSGVMLHGQHILDPRTGQPALHRQAAWALAPAAAQADALSTALMVLRDDELAAIWEHSTAWGGALFRANEAGTLQTFGCWPLVM